MELKKPLPADRSLEQLRHHYQLEKALAERILNSTREERRWVVGEAYERLMREVPDHPRFTRKESASLMARTIRAKFSIVQKYLEGDSVYLEFAPGDCRFGYAVARQVSRAYGVDISDQRYGEDEAPGNFELIVYDGYELDAVEPGSVDIVFSDQLIEHIHPDDVRVHFELAYRLLKSGGVYAFRTPNRHRGPHDISQYFSYEAQGFHLKEWSYGEILPLLRDIGFSRCSTFWNAKHLHVRMPAGYFWLCEAVAGRIPKRYFRWLSHYLLPSVCVVAVK